jgi:hypothetical protein
MAYTFELAGVGPARQIAKVRDEIDDVTSVPGGGVEGKDHFLSDARIAKRLADAQTELGTDANALECELFAAGSALDTLATNQAYVLKKQMSAGKEIDGPSVAKEIRTHAETLRKRARKSLTDRRDAVEVAAGEASEPDGSGVYLETRF